MKIKIIKLATMTLLLASLITTFSACSDSGGIDTLEELIEADEDVDETGSLSALIDDVPYISDGIIAEKAEKKDLLILLTNTSDDIFFDFYLENLEVGTYDFDTDNIGILINYNLYAFPLYTYSTPNSKGELPGGTYTIIAHDREARTISGSFEFTAFQLVNSEIEAKVTDGNFDVTYNLVDENGLIVN